MFYIILSSCFSLIVSVWALHLLTYLLNGILSTPAQ